MLTFAKTFHTKRVLIPYFTFGDPSISFTEELVREAVQAGADIIELGMPFSDPIADGPVIQASHQRALTTKPAISFEDLFQSIAILKITCQVPFVVMTDVNLVLQFGISQFFEQASKSGLDGVILPNVPIEEMSPYLAYAKQYNVAVIQLVSYHCSDERLKKIVDSSEGFLYVISSMGTTGIRQTLSDQLPAFVEKIRKLRDIPVAIGFGVSTPQQGRDIWAYAQGVIVGSVLVQIMAQQYLPQKAIEEVCLKIKTFKQGMLV